MNNEKESLKSVVYHYILNLIFEQKIVSGQKISEEIISKALNVSRTPIREALRMLESEGIVEILPKRYAKIVEFTEKDLKDMATFKVNLEGLTCELVLLKISNEDIYKLMQINSSLEEALSNKDIFNALKLDKQFHEYYCGITDNPYLIEAQYKIRVKGLLYQSGRMKQNITLLNDSPKKHKCIIEALFKRDYNLLLQYSINHITNFYKVDIRVYNILYQEFYSEMEDISKRGEKVLYNEHEREMQNEN